LPGIYTAVTAADINAAAFGIEKNVVGIATGGEGADLLAGVGIEDGSVSFGA